jgi:hypothetical protein
VFALVLLSAVQPSAARGDDGAHEPSLEDSGQAPATTREAESRGMWRIGETIVQPEVQVTLVQRGNLNLVNAHGFAVMGGLTVGRVIADRTVIGFQGMYIGMTHPIIDGHGSAIRTDGTLGMLGAGIVLMGILQDNSTFFSVAVLGTNLVGHYVDEPDRLSPIGIGFKYAAGHLWRVGPATVGVCGSAFGSAWFDMSVGMLGLGAGVFSHF